MMECQRAVWSGAKLDATVRGARIATQGLAHERAGFDVVSW